MHVGAWACFVSAFTEWKVDRLFYIIWWIISELVYICIGVKMDLGGSQLTMNLKQYSILTGGLVYSIADIRGN